MEDVIAFAAMARPGDDLADERFRGVTGFLLGGFLPDSSGSRDSSLVIVSRLERR